MPAHLAELWKFAPVIVVLILALWAGSKGLWYWGPGVRLLIKELERERDEWRELAQALMKRNGLQLPVRPPDSKEEK